MPIGEPTTDFYESTAVELNIIKAKTDNLPTNLSASLTDIVDKIQEVKTKINQMQADINYIKAKVG